MEEKTSSIAEEPKVYERPRIEDYGTLAELTAGLCGGSIDGIIGIAGGWDCGGGKPGS